MSTDAELFAALQAALPKPTRPYQKGAEITARDLAELNGWSKERAMRWLQAEYAAQRWTCEEVMVNGRRANAYRPKGA